MSAAIIRMEEIARMRVMAAKSFADIILPEVISDLAVAIEVPTKAKFRLEDVEQACTDLLAKVRAAREALR